MKFALFNGKKIEATKGASGVCQVCGSELISKCGDIKIKHWAHKSKHNCDAWWENETEWHREWKNCFDSEWQEVKHKDEATGEVHIADVKTPHGWTIEIQHSSLDGDERKARNAFYKKIAWVIDGTRRPTDGNQLSQLLSSGIQLKTKLLTYAINPENKNRLLTEWHNKDSFVFFDFKQINREGQRIIWFVLPKLEGKNENVSGFANSLFIQAFPTSWFIQSHTNGVFDQFFTHEIYDHVLDYCKGLYHIRKHFKIKGLPDHRFSWLLAQ